MTRTAATTAPAADTTDCARTDSACAEWSADYDSQGDTVTMDCPACQATLWARDDDACVSDPGGDVVGCPQCQAALHCCGDELAG